MPQTTTASSATTGQWTVLGALLVSLTMLMTLTMAQDARADHDSCVALHEAAFMDEPDDVRRLLRRGADINCLDVLGQTPLVTAVNGASMASFEILMNAGADVDVRTEFGQTLLTHTKKKYASFDTAAGARFRVLYGDMVALLERAGAHN